MGSGAANDDGGEPVGTAPDPPIVRSLLVKVAALCNIRCLYCYWFRDATVYEAPRLLPMDVEDALLERLERHIIRHALPDFSLILHGGEPLLFGPRRWRRLVEEVRRIEGRTGCRIRVGTTTNGLLIDRGWTELFRELDVGVAVSLDGESDRHDRYRVDFRGAGTHHGVVAAIGELRRAGIEPSILAVLDPGSSPRRLYQHFVDELGILAFDVLIPDATHEDRPAGIAAYLIELFDDWYDHYSHRGVSVRLIDDVIRGLFGNGSRTQSLGSGPITTVTLLTDGSLEAHDTLRIAGDGFTSTCLNITSHEIQDIQRDPLWMEIVRSSVALPRACQGCKFRRACGGGPIASRYAEGSRYDNPSVYCADLLRFFEHVWWRVLPELEVER